MELNTDQKKIIAEISKNWPKNLNATKIIEILSKKNK